MSGIRLAAHLRERERASPRLLAWALKDPQSIAALPDQQVDQLSLPAVAIKTRVGTCDLPSTRWWLPSVTLVVRD